MAAGQQPVRAQVRAYRFATRQVQWAVIHGDPLPTVDPSGRTRRWTMIGFILTVLVLAGAAVYGLVKPVPDWRTSSLILESDTGELLVNRDGRLYPALNLTSALLVLSSGSGAQSSGGAPARLAPQVLKSADIASAPRGPQVGIPGAPDKLPDATAPSVALWSVCEQTSVDQSQAQPDLHSTLISTVVFGTALTVTPLADSSALLVRPAGTKQIYLVRDGLRSLVDLANPAVSRALGLTAAVVRPVGAGLLNTIPEGPAIGALPVPGAGTATRGFKIGGFTVGSVFKQETSQGLSYFVVLADGIQQVPPTAADLLRLQRSNDVNIPELKPDSLTGVPGTSRPLVVSQFPDAPPRLADVATMPTVCSSWDGTDPSHVRRTVSTGQRVQAVTGQTPSLFASNAADAGQADQMLVVGSGAAVRGVRPGQETGPGTIYLISNEGVQFGVPSVNVLSSLGLSSSTQAAPLAMLGEMATGPSLDPVAASRLWDAVPAVTGSTASTKPPVTLPPARGAGG